MLVFVIQSVVKRSEDVLLSEAKNLENINVDVSEILRRDAPLDDKKRGFFKE